LLLAHETEETPGSIDIEVRKNKSLWAQAPATNPSLQILPIPGLCLKLFTATLEERFAFWLCVELAGFELLHEIRMRCRDETALPMRAATS